MAVIGTIAFDADDTLWHNESLYQQAKERFQQLLARYQEPAHAAQRLDETEIHNVSWYGYGIKSFTLSMLETAIELSAGQVTGAEIQQILEFGRHMHRAEVQLFAAVEDTLAQLARQHALMLITKGDLLEQGRKVEKSGLAGYFRYIEIVHEKTPESYRALLGRYSLDPERFLMVGNSLKSDILPVLEIGGQAVYIPYHIAWAHEHAAPGQEQRYFELERLDQLPALVASLNH